MLPAGAQIQVSQGLALVGTMFLGACSFNGGVADSLIDAGIVSDARIDGGTQVCDKNNEALRLCLRFEDPIGATTLVDDSKYGNHPTVANADFTLGFEDRVLISGSDFDSHIPETEVLDPLIALSIEMWLRPAGPIASRQWLFDNENQWGMYLDGGSKIVCDFGQGGLVQSANDVIVPGTWQHVACVYDGDAITLYLNARPLAAAAYSDDLRQQGEAGSCFAQDCPNGGSEYIGQLETLRVWSVGLDHLTLCRGVGLSDDACPIVDAGPSVP